MAGRYSIGRIADSKEFPELQRKVENLYETYNVSIFYL
jgi:hypothetical protein